MTHDQFIWQMNRIKKMFGDRYYPDERLSEYWSYYQNATNTGFKLCVDTLIREKKTPPMFNDFLKILNKKKYVENQDVLRRAQAMRDDATSEIPEDERHVMYNAIRARLNGAISDAAFYTIFPKERLDKLHYCTFEVTITKVADCERNCCPGKHVLNKDDVETGSGFMADTAQVIGGLEL